MEERERKPGESGRITQKEYIKREHVCVCVCIVNCSNSNLLELQKKEEKQRAAATDKMKKKSKIYKRNHQILTFLLPQLTKTTSQL